MAKEKPGKAVEENQTAEPEKAEKKREVKVVYYDDNSTVADMSGTGKPKAPRKQSTAKEKLHTFFAAMKSMVVPMLCTLAALAIMYLVLMLISGRL